MNYDCCSVVQSVFPSWQHHFKVSSSIHKPSHQQIMHLQDVSDLHLHSLSAKHEAVNTSSCFAVSKSLSLWVLFLFELLRALRKLFIHFIHFIGADNKAAQSDEKKTRKIIVWLFWQILWLLRVIFLASQFNLHWKKKHMILDFRGRYQEVKTIPQMWLSSTLATKIFNRSRIF